MEDKYHEDISKFDIAFVGDAFLQTRSGRERPFSTQVESFLRQIPWVMANLETVLTESGQAQQKTYCSRSDPGMASYLHETHVKTVNLANNHTFDYGVEGFRQTLFALEDVDVGYFGVWRDGYQQPFIFQVDGCNIGILGYTLGGTKQVEFGVALLDKLQILKDIEDLKARRVDRVIVNLHWGEEYVAFPSPEQQQIARELIDCGADIIIGHHPHVVQGIERYKEGVIFYSLGNFNFINSGEIDRLFPGTQWGLIVLLHFPQSSPVEYSCIPVQIDDEYRPFFSSQSGSKAFLEYLTRISELLEPGIEHSFWLREASWPHFRNNLPAFIRRIKKYGPSHSFQMIRWLISPSNYAFYLGLILNLVGKVKPLDKPPQCPGPVSQNAN